MIDCLISVGSNVGPREKTLRQACDILADHPHIALTALSAWHETQPVGGRPGQSPFLNGAVRLRTELSADALLACLQSIETQLGRVRLERWGPRTLDLDLLLYGVQRIDRAGLCVPHPRMTFRRFVIDPAVEIAADMLHPTLGWTLARLADHLRNTPTYVALAGPPHAGKTSLARAVAQRLGLRFVADPGSSLEFSPSPQTSPPPSARLLPLEAELALLKQRARCLALSGPNDPAAHRVGLISDFWFDQSLGYALKHLRGRDRAVFHQAWQQLRQTVAPPKLLVVLDTQPAVWSAACRPSAAALSTVASWAAVGQTWRSSVGPLARQPGIGPTLWLNVGQPETALHEIVAAVQAM